MLAAQCKQLNEAAAVAANGDAWKDVTFNGGGAAGGGASAVSHHELQPSSKALDSVYDLASQQQQLFQRFNHPQAAATDNLGGFCNRFGYDPWSSLKGADASLPKPFALPALLTEHAANSSAARWFDGHGLSPSHPLMAASAGFYHHAPPPPQPHSLPASSQGLLATSNNPMIKSSLAGYQVDSLLSKATNKSSMMSNNKRFPNRSNCECPDCQGTLENLTFRNNAM